MNQLTESPSRGFGQFAATAIVGSVAAAGAGWIVEKSAKPDAREAAVFVTRIAAFWIASGLTWIALERR